MIYLKEIITKEIFYEYYITKNLTYSNMATELSKVYNMIITAPQLTHLNNSHYKIRKDISALKENREKTNLEKYGAKYKIVTDDAREKKNAKQQETNAKISHGMKTKTKEELAEIELKRRQTNLLRYGVEYPQQLASAKEKMKKTNMAKYGGPAPIYNTEIKDKIFKNKSRIINTNLNRMEEYNILMDKDKLEKFILDLDYSERTLSNISEKLKFDTSYVDSILLKYNLTDKLNFTMRSSVYEDEICDILKSLNINNIVRNTREYLNGKEIDIFLPDYKFGIEFNGNYWHSEAQEKMQDNGGRSKFHQNKSLLAEKNNIFLFHIFEYEWTNQCTKIKIINRLKNILCKNDNKIYARKCQVKIVDKTDKKDFLDKNHIQGNDNSQIDLGLYYDNMLVAVMTFCSARFTRNCKWELSRFCSLSNYNIIGGANKLFKYFLDNYASVNDRIVSYSDIAKTTGNIYNVLGFEFDHISQPNYVWWNISSKDIRTRYQSRIKNEVSEMRQAGYYRICDCGTKVWIYTKK